MSEQLQLPEIQYACTVCLVAWDHYPEGDEEYGCDQSVEVDGETLFPHNYLPIDEWVQWQKDFGSPFSVVDLKLEEKHD